MEPYIDSGSTLGGQLVRWAVVKILSSLTQWLDSLGEEDDSKHCYILRAGSKPPKYPGVFVRLDSLLLYSFLLFAQKTIITCTLHSLPNNTRFFLFLGSFTVLLLIEQKRIEFLNDHLDQALAKVNSNLMEFIHGILYSKQNFYALKVSCKRRRCSGFVN